MVTFYYLQMRLILASASPRRAELLQAAGLAFETFPVDVDERVLDGETPEACVQRLASAKSAAAEARVSARDARDVTILGADTVVAVDGRILGKPRDIDDAGEMLRRLSGRQHEVATGVSLRRTGRETRGVEITTVSFAELTPAEMDWYLESGEGLDKAGGYAIQGLGSRFVERIAGSYSNVVGLPVALVYRMLR
jgi:septum formation protein